MKSSLLCFLLLLLCFYTEAQSSYHIQPSGDANTQMQGGTTINHVSGSFRWIEYIPAQMKIGATDLVTFYLSKLDDTHIGFDLNCARPLSLSYIFSDNHAKHSVSGKIEKQYRIERLPIDLRRFKEGRCELRFFNENKECIYTFTFEKHHD